VTLATTRAVAICVVRRGDEILVFDAYDEVDHMTYHRPLGGGIGFGEHSEAAVRREFLEEIGAELAELRLLDVIENAFDLEGVPSHEVVFVYEGRFADPSLYDREAFTVDEGSTTLPGLWRPLDTFDSRTAPLYPDGLLELLTGHPDTGAEVGNGRLMSATAAVVHEERILLVRRRDIGTWEMPGGFVEAGEAPWATAVRECLEESRVEVEAGPLVHVYHRPMQDLTVFVFRCRLVRGEPGPTDESLEAAWFDLDALPDPIVEVVRERIADVAGSARGGYRTQTGRGNADVRGPREGP
jgi:ADP-ribose pyrophosphatase YjhB (NUDIX family)